MELQENFQVYQLKNEGKRYATWQKQDPTFLCLVYYEVNINGLFRLWAS